MEWHKQIQADLAEAKSRIAELEIRAENAERKRDEAKARAAKAEAARLDADLQVARDQKRIAELKAHLRKIHDRAHSWRNIPACGDVEQMAAQALGLKGGA